MTLVSYKLLAAALIWLISVTFSLYPLKKQRLYQAGESLHLGEALASGIFLGAAFFHLLPDAIRSFQFLYPKTNYPVPEAFCIGGFLILLGLERIALTNPIIQQQKIIPYLLTFMLMIHAFTEGTALGVGNNFSEISVLLVAILAHKGSESFALCMILLRHQFSFYAILALILVFALITPGGILIGTALNYYTLFGRGELLKSLLDAFAAGTFIYISTLHHTHFHVHKKEPQGLLEFGSLTAGLVIMGVIAIWT